MQNHILPRDKWFWLGLALLLMLAGSLYLRGYNVSLPFFAHVDEAQHLLGAQHQIDSGTTRAIFAGAHLPGILSVNYLLLKHVKPVEAHHGTMLPALRLISIGAWMLLVVQIALLGALLIHPLTGLIGAAFWAVNPWVVERARWSLPEGYLTLFTLLALWLALVGALRLRRSFSTAAVYSIMLAIVFKTQALFVAPIVVLLPLLNWREPALRKDAWQQTFWNCARFAAFLFWLLLLFPTLEMDRNLYIPLSYSTLSLPSLESAWPALQNVWRPFPWSERWLYVAIGAALLWRYRRRLNPLAFVTILLAGTAWMLGMSMFNVQRIRHFSGVGAMLALLYGCGLTVLYFAGREAAERLPRRLAPSKLRLLLAPVALSIVLANVLLPEYRKSEALVEDYARHDRRNDLAQYMDTSLPPGRYITDRRDTGWGIYSVFNRSWGGYDGVHDYPVAQKIDALLSKPLETWRANEAIYAVVPYSDDPAAYFPDDTIRLKSYPPSADFRGPAMIVLRLYPMQHTHSGQLGPIRLAGYDINATQLQAGDELVFRHYWQSDSTTDTPHHVYNHLLDNNGEIVTQSDYVPLWDNRRDTTTWDDPDEIMLGREFRLRLPADLAPGQYRLVSGLYDPLNWQRLVSPTGSDRLLIAEIEISSR
ncbi:MAG: hypothetical protein F4X02_01215 [Chloroflexi bacterium]|nr:hypothetical protein [Chloroflexota bacterium]